MSKDHEKQSELEIFYKNIYILISEVNKRPQKKNIYIKKAQHNIGNVVLFMFFKKSKNLDLKIEKLIYTLEKSNLEDLSNIVGNKKQIIIRNLLAGIFRGVGIGIGITIITAILILLLRHLVALNIPVIGEYISDIVEIVEKSR